MSRWQSPRVLGWFIASLLALSTSCATGDTPDRTSGSLSIDLELRGDTDIDEVIYRVSGNGIDPIEGAIDTSAAGTTYSLEVFGLAEAKNYQVEMMATTVDKTTTCAGVAQFDVAANQITLVYLVLRCGRPEALGGVRVNASINYCAEIILAVAALLQTSVGNDIEVYVVADDWEGDGVEYFWSATGGTIASPTATATTYTCTEVGNQSIAVRISDDGLDYCRDEKTFAVRCVDGDGPECETNDHCEDLEICVGNQCVPYLECTDDAQCNPGEICVQNMCVPAPPECTADWHCDEGESCIDEECVWTGANRCPYFFGAETSPLVQSSGNLINVWSQAVDKDGDPMQVLAESTCGLVSVPLQSTDSVGESETGFRGALPDAV
jgi:hypothetical protein